MNIFSYIYIIDFNRFVAYNSYFFLGFTIDHCPKKVFDKFINVVHDFYLNLHIIYVIEAPFIGHLKLIIFSSIINFVCGNFSFLTANPIKCVILVSKK